MQMSENVNNDVSMNPLTVLSAGVAEQTRISTGRRQTIWLFTSVAEDLNSGLPRNKPRWWSERDSKLGPLECESDTLTTRTSCLLGYAHKSTVNPDLYCFFAIFIGCASAHVE